MSGEMERPESSLRISDADRHRVSELLREAAGEGRLNVDELDERLEAAYAARVYGDLVPILIDLPTGGLDLPGGSVPARQRPASPASPAPGTAVRHDRSLAIMSGQDRRGIWEIGPDHTAVAVMGGIVLDLRQAVFGADEVVITAVALMGGVDIYVDARTRVVVEGLGIMGGFDQARDRVEAEIDDTSPTVRVRGLALMGGVEVTRKPQPNPGAGGWRQALGKD